MRAIGFPVQFPTTPGTLPAVQMAQPASQGWSPARRAKPMMAQRMTRPVGSTMAGRRMGQSEAELWARGSDITFSILTGLAAIVSGLGLVIEFGKGESGRASSATPAERAEAIRTGRAPRVPGGGRTSSKPVWFLLGGGVALLGIANIWSSINRASAIQPPIAGDGASAPRG